MRSNIDASTFESLSRFLELLLPIRSDCWSLRPRSLDPSVTVGGWRFPFGARFSAFRTSLSLGLGGRIFRCGLTGATVTDSGAESSQSAPPMLEPAPDIPCSENLNPATASDGHSDTTIPVGASVLPRAITSPHVNSSFYNILERYSPFEPGNPPL